VDARAEALEAFAAESCSAPRFWGNAPADTYASHSHGFHKVLFCLEGSITFRLEDGDVTLTEGERLDLPPGTEHAATVGPAGCECVEASR